MGSFATDTGGPANPVMSASLRKRRYFIGEAKTQRADFVAEVLAGIFGR